MRVTKSHRCLGEAVFARARTVRFGRAPVIATRGPALSRHSWAKNATAVLVATAGAVFGMPVAAQRPEVVEARSLYRDLHYDRAQQAFEEALSLDGNRPEDLSEIYLHLGLIAGATNDERAAENFFRHALEVNPSLTLVDDLPPKITEPFARARAFWADERLRIVHPIPESFAASVPAILSFEVTGDRMDMVEGVRLSIWSDADEGGEGAARHIRREGRGPHDFTVPTVLVASAREVYYRFEVIGSHDSVLLELNGGEASAVAVIRGRPHVEGGGAEPGGAPDEPVPPTTVRPLYRRWWFWTIIGVVVASGVVVGTVVGVNAQADGIDFGRVEVVP
jgi:hypothetical protein